MPSGAVRRVRRFAAGLLVLTALLLSGAPAGLATMRCPHQQSAHVMEQPSAVGVQHIITPMRDGACDHWPVCCIDGSCVMHAYWVVGATAVLPDPSLLAPAVLAMGLRPLSGIATPPLSPPPRDAV